MTAVAAKTPRPRPAAPEPYSKPLKSLAFVRAMRRNPIAVFSTAFYEKPAVFTDTIIGKIAVVSDPDAVRRILIDNRDNYRRDSFQQRMLLPMVGGSLVTSEGDDWRRQRRHLAPLFTPQMVESLQPAMARAADESVADLKTRPDGAVIDTPQEMARAAVGVLGATIFGDGIAADHGEIARTLATYVDRVGRVDFADALGLPRWVPRINLWLTRRQRALFPRFVADILAARARRSGDPPGNDVVSALLSSEPGGQASFSQAEISGNLMLFLSAGYESTANTLTWAAYLLSLDPEWRDRVEAEADRELPDGRFAGSIDRMTDTRAVVEESLRLYPPVAALGRQAVGPDRLCGHDIPPGTLVVVSTWLLHRHRQLWRDADLFDPSRFLGEARGRIGRFSFLPFGAGARVCVAASFAMAEAIILLSSLARHFRFEAVPGHEVAPLHRITLRPANGLPLKLIRRHRR
jgi:cytochrome P450